MTSDHDQLLAATIQHLETLKARGVRFVNVAPTTLEQLARPRVQAASEKAEPASLSSVVAPRSGLKATPPAGSPQTALPSAFPAPGVTSAAPVPAAPVPEISRSAPAGDKAEAMAQLRARALACTRCSHLAATRKNVVFGVGDINASLMFIGEAPGADEDARGEPFVGLAGQLLTKIIQAMGLSRQTVYIGNILKCRPNTPGQSAGNRPPTEEEMETCIPYLLEQIDLIQPKVIVALGATAVKGLLHNKTGITRLRGQWQIFRGIPTMPTYHPAYLLRNQAISEKRKVWEDMLQVMERLGLPMSEKQRGFFLKAQ